VLGLGLKSKASQIWAAANEKLTNIFQPKLIMKGKKEDLSVVFSEPHDMPIGDRIVLYGLIRGFKPRTYLEIGVRWGGSARIVSTAMEANGFGKAVGLDPDLSNFRPKTAELFGRYEMIKGYSPEDTPKAIAKLSSLDFVFIDAVHTYSAVKSDLEGILPHLPENTLLLFHDAFHQGVNQAVDEFLNEHGQFIDWGMVSRNAAVGAPVSYAGLRLMRRSIPAFSTELAEAHERAGVAAPVLSSEFRDHDPYAIRMGNPLGRPDKTG